MGSPLVATEDRVGHMVEFGGWEASLQFPLQLRSTSLELTLQNYVDSDAKKDAKRNPLWEVQRKWAGCPSLFGVQALAAVRRRCDMRWTWSMTWRVAAPAAFWSSGRRPDGCCCSTELSGGRGRLPEATGYRHRRIMHVPCMPTMSMTLADVLAKLSKL